MKASVELRPMSHPFVERLIGSTRREPLDQTLSWTGTDLENELRGYRCYFNQCRAHSGRVWCHTSSAVPFWNYRAVLGQTLLIEERLNPISIRKH